ncbi:hypothetical protein D3C87_1907370 [compost metagenome]
MKAPDHLHLDVVHLQVADRVAVANQAELLVVAHQAQIAVRAVVALPMGSQVDQVRAAIGANQGQITGKGLGRNHTEPPFQGCERRAGPPTGTAKRERSARSRGDSPL